MYPILPYSKYFRKFNRIAHGDSDHIKDEHFKFDFKRYDVIFNPSRVSKQIKKYDLKKLMERIIGSTVAPISTCQTTQQRRIINNYKSFQIMTKYVKQNEKQLELPQPLYFNRQAEEAAPSQVVMPALRVPVGLQFQQANGVGHEEAALSQDTLTKISFSNELQVDFGHPLGTPDALDIGTTQVRLDTVVKEEPVVCDFQL